jgi:alpha-glucuronidase
MKMILVASKKIIWICVLVSLAFSVKADDGHNLWLRPVKAKPVKVVGANAKSVMMGIAKKEIEQRWLGNENATVEFRIVKDPTVKADGFKITGNAISATSETGILYGTYELLRRQQTGDLSNVISNPSYQRRILNHWDNLNGTIERGYAGNSIFWRTGSNEFTVTDRDKQLWEEYARANASIGINGAVLNNVNASALILDPNHLERLKAIATVLRPYGIKTYLSVNFASPIGLGKLANADPLNPEVVKWWKAKVAEIYKNVPDFGGFLVKANSEGQPGPQDYKRTHVDGANMLADALKPHNGIVMWRAFVYNAAEKDRAKQAYLEFMPFDGQFRDNVIIQVKNGPIDFQPREPFSPLFGALKKTPIMPELQVTQEYLGHSEQLVFLAPMWEEMFKSDTYQEGKNSTVARVTDGSLFPQKYTAIAGVSNVGLDTNWNGHDFAQANWYAYGRQAWNNQLDSKTIADEWIKLTFAPADGNTAWKNGFLEPVKKMMLESREVAVDYSMPLGLHHTFAGNHHYGPGPWWAPPGTRKDWTPAYYHQADANGIGFDRTKKGTDAVSQYHEPLASQFNDVATTPENYLLYFHHLPWDYKMKNGKTLWDDLCSHWDSGVKQVRQFQVVWDKVEPYVDAPRFTRVQEKLRRHARDAQFWKDANLLYFQQFSKRPLPDYVERPINNLDYYIKTNPLTMQQAQAPRR